LIVPGSTRSTIQFYFEQLILRNRLPYDFFYQVATSRNLHTRTPRRIAFRHKGALIARITAYSAINRVMHVTRLLFFCRTIHPYERVISHKRRDREVQVTLVQQGRYPCSCAPIGPRTRELFSPTYDRNPYLEAKLSALDADVA